VEQQYRGTDVDYTVGTVPLPSRTRRLSPRLPLSRSYRTTHRRALHALHSLQPAQISISANQIRFLCLHLQPACLGALSTQTQQITFTASQAPKVDSGAYSQRGGYQATRSSFAHCLQKAWSASPMLAWRNIDSHHPHNLKPRTFCPLQHRLPFRDSGCHVG
jgi:hypothetical protein